MPNWTEHEKTQLRQLKGRGVKLPTIMRLLNKSKGQVCGQWNRMNGYKTKHVPRNNGTNDRTMWTDASLTERWADRQMRRSAQQIQTDLEGVWSDA